MLNSHNLFLFKVRNYFSYKKTKRMFKSILKIIFTLNLINETKFQQISLNRNNLAEICQCTPTESLKIDLSNKGIVSIDPATFNGLTKLVQLDLESNKLTTIDPDTFKGLNSLQKLDLDKNELTSIDPAIFNGLYSLQNIDLDNNQLTALNPSTFIDLTALIELDIGI